VLIRASTFFRDPYRKNMALLAGTDLPIGFDFIAYRASMI